MFTSGCQREQDILVQIIKVQMYFLGKQNTCVSANPTDETD
jgi:hypothetical protein